MKTELVRASESGVAIILVDDGSESNIVTLSHDFYSTLQKMLKLELNFDQAAASPEFSDLEQSRIKKIQAEVRFHRTKPVPAVAEKSPRDVVLFEVKSRIEFLKNHTSDERIQTYDYAVILGEAQGMTRIAQCLEIFSEKDVSEITFAVRDVHGVVETQH